MPAVVMAGWDDVPHLSEAEKTRLLAAIPEYQRDARSRGIPQIGEGAIYPMQSEAYTIEDFPIPPHWPRGYGFDVGWRATAAAFLAHDLENDVIYQYAEYQRGKAEPPVHVAAIKAKGEKLWGAIDPASQGGSQENGRKLFATYEGRGLNLIMADNAVEAGIYEVWLRMTTGRLKVFKSCRRTISQMGVYRRNEHGKIVKSNDHLCDCLRYGVRTSGVLAYVPANDQDDEPSRRRGGAGSWMGS